MNYVVEIEHKYFVGEPEEGIHFVNYLVEVIEEDFLPDTDCMKATATNEEAATRKAILAHLEEYFIGAGDILHCKSVLEYEGNEDDFLIE